MAVSKGVPVERILWARAAGVVSFGENRVREAEAKVPLVAGVSWQLVGRLQSNKAARAVAIFEVIHSLDSLLLARRLDGLAAAADRRLPVYLQVNVDGDPAKAGFAAGALTAALPELLALPALDVRGLMTIGRMVVDPEGARPGFGSLRSLSQALRGRHPGLGGGLSMGMSADFEVAVEEGATAVRIGSAIFGRRP